MFSAFSKVHMVIALFAGLNILMGLALTFPIPNVRLAALVHFWAGIFLVLSPMLVLPFLKNPKPVWTAFKVRLALRKGELNHRTLLAAKVFAWLFLLGIVFSALGGVFIRSGMAAWLFPEVNLLKLHVLGIYLLPSLLFLHVGTMLLLRRGKTR